MEGIRAVLFDAGNTLIRVRGSVGNLYAEVARRHGLPASGRRLEQRFQEVFGERKASFLRGVSRPHSEERERTWWRELVREVFRRNGGEESLGGRFEAYFEELYRAFGAPRHWELFPDVLPCLDTLEARGLPAAVVSNWDSRLHGLLVGLGLGGRFRFVLTSAEFGAEKPDPSIFQEAVRRLGLDAGAVAHVGDLVRDDLQGARTAGLRAILVARGGRECGGEPCVKDLRDVPGLLA